MTDISFSYGSESFGAIISGTRGKSREKAVVCAPLAILPYLEEVNHFKKPPGGISSFGGGTKIFYGMGWDDFGRNGFTDFATTLPKLYATMCSNRKDCPAETAVKRLNRYQ